MAVRPAVIVDVETTSLTPDYQNGSGVIWELAMIWQEDGAEHLWRMKPDLGVADPSALSVGQFYKRTEDMCEDCRNPDRAYDLAGSLAEKPEWSSPAKLAALTARLLDGATVIAANPAFDTAFLSAFLRWHSHAPTWHYRLRDIGSIAYGYLCKQGVSVPSVDASTDAFAEALGVFPDAYDRHSALGDCRLVAAMLDVVERGAQ